MAKNRIQMGRTNFFLSSDRLNWIVAKRAKVNKCKSHPDGYKFIHETYHDKPSGAFQRVFSEITKTTAVDTIEDILRVHGETYEMLKRILDYDFKDEKEAA